MAVFYRKDRLEPQHGWATARHDDERLGPKTKPHTAIQFNTLLCVLLFESVFIAANLNRRAQSKQRQNGVR
jgi:hypothetical protein